MSQCPPQVDPFARDPNLTSGRQYDVHSIAVYNGVVLLLVVDDLGFPGWKPAWFFDTTDVAVPKDWICNTLPGCPELLAGPAFIASSQSAYAKMVELDKSQVTRLRRRIAMSQTPKHG